MIYLFYQGRKKSFVCVILLYTKAADLTLVYALVILHMKGACISGSRVGGLRGGGHIN